MRGSGYGHIADSVRAKLAVRITARFGDLAAGRRDEDASGVPEFGGQVPEDATAAGIIAAVASQLSLPARTLRRGRNDEVHDAVCVLRRGGLP
jgi:hypothetical protein